MKISAIIPVICGVLKSPVVIGAAVAVILYLNFVFYVSRYRKRPPRPKIKRAPKPAEKPAEKPAGQEGAKTEEGGGE